MEKITVQSIVASIAERKFQRMNQFVSDYARFDHPSCKVLIERLESAARQKRLVTYEELVRGVTFSIPDSHQSLTMVKKTVDSSVLSAEDEALIHDFGRYLATATFRDSSVYINSLLIRSKSSPYPSALFFDWVRRIDLIRLPNRQAELDYWIRSIAAVHQAYR